MELIIGLIVIAAVGYFVFFRKKDEPVVETSSAPYKVETPVPAADVAPQPTTVVVEGAGVVELPQPTPVAEEAPAKKPRKPRAPKAEKSVAKKAAPKKATAMKAAPKAKTTKSKKA